MKYSKIVFDFKTYGDSAFLSKAGNIASSMTNNVFFPDPVPVLPAVQEALGQYAEALNAAMSLGRDNVAAKNQARTTLELLLVQMAMYAMFIANGDRQILISTGYTISKDPEPRYLENPGNVILTNGISTGEVKAQVKNVATAGYVFQISTTLPAEDTVWTGTSCSKSQFVFKSLVPGTQYWVRVAALGTRNQIAYSTIATIFAQ